MGQVLLAAGCIAESEPHLADAAQRGDREALVALVTCLRRLGRHADALAHCDAQPAHDGRLAVLRGECLYALDRCDEAIANFRDTIVRAPDNAFAWHGLARALRWLGRHREALAAWREVQRIGDPRVPFEATLDLALALQATGDLRAAIELLAAAVRGDPSIEGHRTLAQLLLAAGRLREAWNLYEFRWMLEPLLSTWQPMQTIAWSGQDLAGRTILVRVEQGLGDVIQFMRYARLLRDLGARVVVGPFSDIAGRFAGVDHVRAPGERHESCDYHVNVMSLPRLFGTTLETIPADVPYVAVDEAKAAAWRARLAGPARLRVGLVWAGGARHPADRARSLHVRELAPLLDVADVRFVALQKGPPAAQVHELGLASRLLPLADELVDFSDTAAAIAALDLVIAVDTSVAHLAGALARPVWMLVATPADWRWLEDREDSPWYPTLRLFRQQEPGDWGGVVERVRAALEERVRGGTAPAVAPVSRTPSMPHARGPEELLAAHPSGLAAVAETADGILQYLPGDLPVGASLACYGEYLRVHLETLGARIGTGMTVLELGAGVGVHTLYLARCVQAQGHVLAVEADRVRRQMLRENMAVNRCANVTIVEPAADADAGTLVDALRLARLDWLKLGPDARRAIDGAQRTLWELRPGVFASVGPRHEASALVHRLRDFGYRCWIVEAALFRAANFAGHPHDIFHDGTACGVFAIPEERADDFSLQDAQEIE